MSIQETVQGREMLNRVNKRQRAVKKLKFKQEEAFLNSLLKTSIGVLEKYFNLRIGSLKPIFEIEGLVCTRDFSSCKNKPKNILIIRKADRICEESKRYFSKHSIMTKCKQLSLKKPPTAKPPAAKSLCYTIIESSPSCLPSFKLCPPIAKYITQSLSCHHESINLKCRSILSSPLRLVICPKSIKKLPSLKIYKKRPLLLKNLKSSSPSPFKYSKFSTRLKYPLKQKYVLQDIQEPCELYFPLYSRSYSSCSRSVSQYLQEICKNSLELRKNKEILTHRDLFHLISLHRVHWRGFHNSLSCLVNSNSDKSSACKKMDEICKSTEVKETNQRGQPCNKKSDICRQKKVKCDKRQQPDENKAEAKSKSKTEQKIADPVCKKTCLARGKCEWPQTVPPPKMEYVKVTCLPPKFTKPNPCPSTSEHFQKDDGARIEAKKTNIQKKQICAPTPLPKPPFGPTALCPCPPPHKMHPGPCPCYERKEVPKPSVMKPCPLKKKYPCPTGIHYCPLQKKPCNLKQDSAAIGCEHKKKKKTPAL